MLWRVGLCQGREETSLECLESRFLYYQNSLPRGMAGIHCINFYFECDTAGTVRLNHESTDYAWIGPDDIGKYEIIFRNDEALARYWNLTK